MRGAERRMNGGAVPWADAMAAALYGPGGFFVAGPPAGAGPVGHFRTSAHVAPALAAAVLRLVTAVDAALGQP
ncbi:MAG TPA: hypothetical protein VES42_03695, partial [Pilimelia sp.]|nr:hypothetical protein [Pilimelia sp.]